MLPVCSSGEVLRDSSPDGVSLSEPGLPLGIPLFGSAAMPVDSFGEILWGDLAILIDVTQSNLGRRIALFSSKTEIVRSFFVVDRNMGAPIISETGLVQF